MISKQISRETQTPIVIISGIGANATGTGRLIEHILNECKTKNFPHRFFHSSVSFWEAEQALAAKQFRTGFILLLRWGKYWVRAFKNLLPLFLKKDVELILFHPQQLGMLLAFFIFQLKRGKKALFLLDSSFFCLRSYNHLPGENQPCMRCVGGDFKNIKIKNCKPFPNPNWFNKIFLMYLRKVANSPDFRFIAQNQAQALVAREHFGSNAAIDIAGMWTPEFDEMLEKNKSRRPRVDAFLPSRRRKLVFHGHDLPSKGSDWCFNLAQLMPDIDIVFPFEKPSRFSVVPPNVLFQPMSWNNGLEEAILASDGILVPSLWSACIEGALIKSLFAFKPTFVVQNQSSFSNEIASPPVFVLPTNTTQAAVEIAAKLSYSSIDFVDKTSQWIDKFSTMRAQFWEVLAKRSIL